MSRQDQTTTGRLQELQEVEEEIILKKFFSTGKKKKSCIGERFKTSDCSKSSGSQKSAETILQHWWTKCCG